MKNIALNLLVFIFLLGLFLNFSVTAFAASGSFGLDSTASVAFNNTGIKKADLILTVGNLVNTALSFIGVVFLILIIYGGFLWMTAGGSDDKVKKAIDIFTNSALGLMIVVAAYLITRYIGTAIINSLQ
jgi:hypothetical protein